MVALVSVGSADGGEAPKRQHVRRSLEEKRRLVAVTYEAGTSVALVARRHDVNANQLFAWRRLLVRQPLALSNPSGVMDFAPIDVVSEPRRDERAGRVGLIEVELPSGAKLRVDAQVDELALWRVLSALKAAS
jgi:transposase